MKRATIKLLKGIAFLLAWFFLAVGFIGIFVPLLPTTPFVLLSLVLFSKSSPKFVDWIEAHPKIGPPILDWKRHRVIRLKPRLLATFMLASSGVYLFTRPSPSLLAMVGFSISTSLVLLFLWTRKLKP